MIASKPVYALSVLRYLNSLSLRIRWSSMELLALTSRWKPRKGSFLVYGRHSIVFRSVVTEIFFKCPTNVFTREIFNIFYIKISL